MVVTRSSSKLAIIKIILIFAMSDEQEDVTFCYEAEETVGDDDANDTVTVYEYSQREIIIAVILT